MMRPLFLSVLLLSSSVATIAQTNYDARILEYTGLKYPCAGGATPVVRIKNIGTQTMSGCVVETWKNGLQPLRKQEARIFRGAIEAVIPNGCRNQAMRSMRPLKVLSVLASMATMRQGKLV
jgi:hypothetical protein